jgi:hypothetical protein
VRACKLPNPCHHAYMAGQYKADREHYMSQARADVAFRHGYVKAAREAHHHYMEYLARALAASPTP